jgi:hypothetical protein
MKNILIIYIYIPPHRGDIDGFGQRPLRWIDLPLQSGYYPSETVAYPKYRQDLTHRGVLWPLENEPPFPKKN